jgi:hypothetical protein
VAGRCSRGRTADQNWRGPAEWSGPAGAVLAVAAAALGLIVGIPAARASTFPCSPFITGADGLTVALDGGAADGSAAPFDVFWGDQPAGVTGSLPQFHTYQAAKTYGVQVRSQVSHLLGDAKVTVGPAAANPVPYAFSAAPITASSALAPGQTTTVTLRLTGPGGAVPQPCGDGTDGAFAWLSFTSAAGGSASAAEITGGAVSTIALGATPQLFEGNTDGSITISYTAPSSSTAAGTDTITAANLAAAATVSIADTYQYTAVETPPPTSSPPPASPGIGSVSVTPQSLPRHGGTVQLTWTALNATACSLTSSPAGMQPAGLQEIPCSAGAVTERLIFPRHRGPGQDVYQLTLTADGATGTTPAVRLETVTVGVKPGPPAAAGPGPHPPVLLLIGLLGAAGAAGLLGLRLYRRSRGRDRRGHNRRGHDPAAPLPQVQAVPHAGPPRPVTVHRTGADATLTVRIEPHDGPVVSAITLERP